MAKMQETVWHTNTNFHRYGLKLRQHQTLPPTPENAAESGESDVEGDVTDVSHNGGHRTSVRMETEIPGNKMVFFADRDDDILNNSRTRSDSSDQGDIPQTPTPDCRRRPDSNLYLSATSAGTDRTQSSFSSIRRNVPPSLQSIKQTNSVSSDERGPQTPFQPEAESPEPRCNRWSLNQLRKQFQEVKIEDLYQRFWLRLQQTLLIEMLVVVAVCILIFLILNNVLVKHQNGTTILWTNLFLGLSLLLCAVCGALVFHRKLFTRFSIPISLLTWACLIIFLYAFMPFAAKGITISPTDNVPMTFFVIFIMYTMLPAPRRVVIALGILTAVLDLIIIGVHFNMQPDFNNATLVTNAIVYISAIATGFYHKHLMDLAHRHTFLDVRRFIEEDIQNTKERDRQNRMKEGLLLKIIPKHLLEGMKKVLNKKLVEVNVDSKNMFSDMNYESPEGVRTLSLKRKVMGVRFWKKGSLRNFSAAAGWNSNTGLFRELFVTKSDLASILYADIVSFTPLTMSLTPAELVCALNELFGQFDELAKANRCLRIKILGDCYYCVSGLPDPTPDHATNAVIMGMQMIKVIGSIREETGLEKLNMRIGIHSGHLLSGVLGLKKWQYDVWSDDVTIANHMESSGQPGKVHITEATLKELKGEFEVVPAHGKDRDELLKENDIETYFIADHELEKIVDDDLLRINGRRMRSRGLQRQKAIKRRISMYEAVEGWGAEMPFEGMTEFMMSGTLPALNEVNKRLEKGFHLQRSRNTEDDSFQMFNFKFDSLKGLRNESRRSSSKSGPEDSVTLYRQRLRKHKEEINQKTLLFRSALMEEKYANQLDESFKFYIICAFCIFAFLTTVQLIQFKGSTIIIINMFVGGIIFLLLIIISSGLKFLPCYERIPKNMKDTLESSSTICVSDFRLKILLSSISSVIIFVSSVVPLIDCHWQNSRISPANESVAASAQGGPFDYSPTSVTSGVSLGSDEKACLFAPYFLYSCMLSLIVCSVFLRVSYIFKIIYMTTCLLLYNIMFYVIFPLVFSRYDEYIATDFIKSQVKGTLDTGLLFITLVVLGRQIEQNLRLDFLCKSKIQIDRQELRRNEMLNTMLLNNILPSHVAAHFTNPKRRKNELYHQLCKNAVVIFAAVPNFKAFFSEIDVTGKECLRMLNEIISVFDDMLIMRQYDGVEKIKTIGSTYMAASGLVPSEEDDNVGSALLEKNLVVMIQFAFGMIKKLEELSKDAFYEYKLRIGICHGEVIAGVVGAQKPQYDIWGDTVNTASRMESHGITGAIQVPEKTAMILQRLGYPCEYRDEIVVKGKGKMKVYLVQTPENKMASQVSLNDMDNGRVQIVRECRRGLYMPDQSLPGIDVQRKH